MVVSSELLEVTRQPPDTGGGGVPAVVPFVGIYWPSSAGSTVEAWEINAAGAVVEAPMSSVSAPFTPSNNVTGNGEATTHPGEMISDRTVLLNEGTTFAIAFLSDDKETMAVWDVDADTITSVALSPTAGWDHMGLCAADGEFHAVYLYEGGTDAIEIKNVTPDGTLTTQSTTFGGSTVNVDLRGMDDKGAFVLKDEGTSGTRDLVRYGWDGSSVALSTNNSPSISVLGQRGGVTFATRGTEYTAGSSVCWSQYLITDGKGLVSQLAASALAWYSLASGYEFGNLGAPDASIAQHVSANDTTAACWRYQDPGGGNDLVAMRPSDASVSFPVGLGERKVTISPRTGDSARAHLVMIADHDADFTP